MGHEGVNKDLIFIAEELRPCFVVNGLLVFDC